MQLRFLPPLLGIFFAYLVLQTSAYQKSYEKFGASWYIALGFTIFCEQVQGFYLFSSVIAFLLFFNFFVDWLSSAMKWRGALLFIYVASGYIWSFCINNLIAYAKDEEMLKFSGEYIFYILFEAILAIIFFRGRAI